MSDTHSIEIRDLKVAFGDVVVFEKMNLDVTDGEFLVLLGASGCGKSTLLNCIAGLLDVKDGEIHIKGRNVTWEEPKDRGIGMVFQSYALYPQMSVKRNLSFGLRNAGVKNDEVERRVAQAADVLQIEPLLNRRPAELSGASGSGSPLAARWSVTWTCSCSTSRCPTSTPSCAPICGSRSSACTSA